MNKFKEFPLTYMLIAINVIAYLFSAYFSKNIVDMNMETLIEMGALVGQYTVEYKEWWRLLTAMFLHGGMTHILMNMFSLYLIGRGLEVYFQKKAYLSIYFFSGVIGGLASLYMHPLSVGVGASGAIFGVFGALAGFFLAHRDKIAQQSKQFIKDFGIVLGLNLVLGFSIESIDVSAHIGGLVIGMIGGFVIAKNYKWVWLYSAAMTGVMLLMISYLSQHYVGVVN